MNLNRIHSSIVPSRRLCPSGCAIQYPRAKAMQRCFALLFPFVASNGICAAPMRQRQFDGSSLVSTHSTRPHIPPSSSEMPRTPRVYGREQRCSRLVSNDVKAGVITLREKLTRCCCLKSSVEMCRAYRGRWSDLHYRR